MGTGIKCKMGYQTMGTGIKNRGIKKGKYKTKNCTY